MALRGSLVFTGSLALLLLLAALEHGSALAKPRDPIGQYRPDIGNHEPTSAHAARFEIERARGPLVDPQKRFALVARSDTATRESLDVSGLPVWRGYLGHIQRAVASHLALASSHGGIQHWERLETGAVQPKIVGTPNGQVQGLLDPVPKVLWLSPIYPNPMLSRASLHLELPYGAEVRMGIYDVQGRTVYEARYALPAGRHELAWNGEVKSGQHAGAGVYFARVAIGGRTIGLRRVVLLH